MSSCDDSDVWALEEKRNILEQILDTVNTLDEKKECTSKIRKPFPEEYHQRRHHIYTAFHPNIDTFFMLRANGVPIITSYFMSEPSNVTRVHRQLQRLSSNDEKKNALTLLKNI